MMNQNKNLLKSSLEAIQKQLVFDKQFFKLLDGNREESMIELHSGSSLIVDSMIEVLEDLYEDSEGWIKHFVWETHFGEHHNEISVNNIAYKLETIEKFVNIFFEKLKH